MLNSSHVVTLTEKEAAMEYARAWNRLECGELVKLLSADAYYAS